MSDKMSDITFEKSMSNLDEIVKQLEQGDISLGEMLKLFEKGIALSRVCNELLNQAEKRVNVLIKKDDGYEKEEFHSSEGV